MHCARMMTLAEYRDHPMVRAFEFTMEQPPVCSWCLRPIEAESFMMLWTMPPDNVHCRLAGMPQVECLHTECREAMGAALRKRWATAGESERFRALLRRCCDVWFTLASSHGCETTEDAEESGALHDDVMAALGED